jgi:hypothetical protein
MSTIGKYAIWAASVVLASLGVKIAKAAIGAVQKNAPALKSLFSVFESPKKN